MDLVVPEGLIIFALVLTGLRVRVFTAIPEPLKYAIDVGIGLFIALIGLVDAGIVRAGVPVMAHIGYTPQSEHGLGGHIIQGRGEGAEQLLADAHAIEEAGAFAVVLEMVPSSIADAIYSGHRFAREFDEDPATLICRRERAVLQPRL